MVRRRAMGALAERIAALESGAEERGKMVDGVRESVVSLETRMDRRFESLEIKMDRRFEGLEARMDRRFETSEAKMDHRFETMDAKMSRQFLWLVGIQVTTLATIVAAVVAAFVKR
jgi:hypothetical protein